MISNVSGARIVRSSLKYLALVELIVLIKILVCLFVY